MAVLRAIAARYELVLAVVGLVFLGILVTAAVGSGDDAPGPGSDGVIVHGDGLSTSHTGYRLVADDLPADTGNRLPVEFQILGPSGRPQTEYLPYRTKPMHLLVLRDDTHAYQRVFPTLDGDTWRAEISVPDGGQYRIFTIFVPKGEPKDEHPTVLGAPFVVPGDTQFVPMPEPHAEVEVGGVTVTRPDGPAQPPVDTPVRLRFRFTDDTGKPVDLEPYLGNYATIWAFNGMTLAAHDVQLTQQPGDPLPGGELSGTVEFDERGEHRVFVEFQVDGEVHVAAFTVFAT